MKPTWSSTRSAPRPGGRTGTAGGTTDDAVPSTSSMRSAQTAARGTITSTNVAIITDIRICSRYDRNAVSAPTCICPSAMRCPPNHSTATLDTLSTSITIGNISAVSRPTAVAVSVRLAVDPREPLPLERLAHEGPHHPDAGDLLAQHQFTASIRTCMLRKPGTIRRATSPIDTASTGTLTPISHDSPRSSRSAMTTPPTQVIGAATSSEHDRHEQAAPA
ncbi:hypothetical protein GCM10025868_46320 [Angustibacter aerolatus]|uniref:DUF11 domain-containing protein n=1 Tax=Angustibacter aerolatus TaxID=1162965 RepID=A0ABQ6JM79_9ACTN|nr:hypothetical protein GCM10025868_46320 [Angustibacter aerolatus]